MVKETQFGGYSIKCTAVADSDGKFTASLIVARVAWPSRPRVIAMERMKHESPDAAIDAAQKRAISWIGDHG